MRGCAVGHYDMKRLCITLGLVFCLVFNASGYAAENPLGIKPHPEDKKSIYTLGLYAGGRNYRALGPFGVGLMTGMLLPFATGGAVSYGRQKFNDSNTADYAIGIVAFTASILGPYQLAKLCPTPAFEIPETYLDSQGQEQYRLGYEKGIANKRLGCFTVGVILGPVVDIFLIIIVLCNSDPIVD
jgi:hypothetical protein